MVGSLRCHAGASRRAAFGSHNPYHITNPMPRENHGRGWQMPDVPLPSKVEQLLHSLHCASELQAPGSGTHLSRCSISSLRAVTRSNSSTRGCSLETSCSFLAFKEDASSIRGVQTSGCPCG